MLRIKMNKFLNELGVRFDEENEEFIITTPETDNVKSIVDYNDFPEVKYDYNTGELYIKVDVEDIDEVLCEIVAFIEAEKEKIRKASVKVAKILREAKDE